MKTGLLPKKVVDKSLSVQKALSGSEILSKCFLLMYENKKVKVNEVAAVLDRSGAQIYQLYSRLNHLGVVKKIPRKTIFVMGNEFDEATIELFKKDALVAVGGK